MNIVEIIWLKTVSCNFFNHLLHVVIPNEFLEISTIFLSILVSSVISVILFNLLKKSRLKQRQAYFKKIFNELICEIAVCETEEELMEVFSKEDYQNIFDQYQRDLLDRSFLIEELATTCKEFNGVTRNNINWLFKKTTLKNDLLLKLKDKRWYVVAKAIQQSAYLQLKDMLPHIFLLANHNNDLVRMEAQVATVKLVGFDGLRFLNVISYPISEWQQLRLIQELSGHTVEKFENIGYWLQSKNHTVVEFALRLTGIYQRHEYYEKIKTQLIHPAESICLQAVETVMKINDENTTELLVNLFPTASINVQEKIAEVLKNTGAVNELIALQERIRLSANRNATDTVNGANDTAIDEMEKAGNSTKLNRNIPVPQLNIGGAL